MGVGAAAPRFDLVTREGCHLCDEMEAVLAAVLPEYGLSYGRLDVDADVALERRFGDVVPVLLRDGKPVAKVRLDRALLVRLIERRAV